MDSIQCLSPTHLKLCLGLQQKQAKASVSLRRFRGERESSTINMRLIVTLLFAIVFNDLVGSNRSLNGTDGVCQCRNIDPTKYSNEPSYRIMNGTFVQRGDLSWATIVFFRFCRNATYPAVCESPQDYQFLCTGILITKQHVLLAAHVSWHTKCWNLFRFISFFKSKCLVGIEEWIPQRGFRNVTIWVSIESHVRQEQIDANYERKYVRKVQNYTYHSHPNSNDIGILQLQTSFVLGEETDIYPACLLNQTKFKTKPDLRFLAGSYLKFRF